MKTIYFRSTALIPVSHQSSRVINEVFRIWTPHGEDSHYRRLAQAFSRAHSSNKSNAMAGRLGRHFERWNLLPFENYFLWNVWKRREAHRLGSCQFKVDWIWHLSPHSASNASKTRFRMKPVILMSEGKPLSLLCWRIPAGAVSDREGNYFPSFKIEVDV